MKILFLLLTLCPVAFAGGDLPGNIGAGEFGTYVQKLFAGYPKLPVKKVTAQPKLIKGSSAYKFRTEIRRQTKIKEANFAGNWVLVAVGCGTGCARYFVMNATTGKVIDPNLDSNFPIFRPDKALLLATQLQGAATIEEVEHDIYGGPKAFVWKNEKFEKVELKIP